MRDVVVLGAGIAGSSVAHVLAQLGWDVVLLERDKFPRHKVCGEFLSPEAQASLKAMGLYEVVKSLSPALIEQARLISPAGLTVPVALPGQAWGISRFALDAALVAAAQKSGVNFQPRVTATAVTPTEAGFEVAVRSKRGPAVVRARAVLAACGRYSQPGLPPRAVSKQQSFVGLKCHFENVRMPPQVELFFFPGGYVGLAPVEAGRVNLCMLITPAALTLTGKRIQPVLTWLVEQNPALAQRLKTGRMLPETEVSVAPVDIHRPAKPWDRMACLGDTAVMIPPLCGDGMAMALHSATLCAPLAHNFLRGHLSLAAWATAYQSAWQAEFGRAVRFGRYLQMMLNAPVLAEAVLGLGRLVPPLARMLVRATRGGASAPILPVVDQ
jgi:flavin-dependent dehydrogenase